MPQIREVSTPGGPARAHLLSPAGGRARASGTLMLGHGAGGGIEAADLQLVAAGAVRAGWAVALVEQPWRVAGRRVAAAPVRLDEGWTAVVGSLRTGRSRLPEPFVFGGRSAGARVACRLAGPLHARAVVALAFPLHPPGRPERSRLAELVGAVRSGAPVLVVQGQRDPFGTPEELQAAVDGELSGRERASVQIVGVPGDHGLKPGAQATADAVRAFLDAL